MVESSGTFASMTITYEDIRYEIDGPAAVITIARPERYNAFRGQTIEELIAAFRAAWADRSVRCVVLTGEGEKAFCSGGDVKACVGHVADPSIAFSEKRQPNFAPFA